MKTYPVVILAGYSAEVDALAQQAGVRYKALLPIRGRPMLSYVVDAWRESGLMRRLVLVGPSPDDLPELRPGCPLTCLPNRGSFVDNLLAALDVLEGAEHFVLSTGDIPLVTAEGLRDFLDRAEASGAGFCYPVVRREVMEARFPGSGRSFRRLVDGDFAGGDVDLISPAVVRNNVDFARTLSAGRKSAWKLVQAMGLGIILRFLVHRLRIRDLEKQASKILGCECKAIVSPYAEVAMDVDKPHHLEVVLRATGGVEL